MSMTSERLAEIKARCDAATAGPWCEGRHDMATIEHGEESKWIYGPENEVALATGIGRDFNAVLLNAIFIAHARADVPELVAEVERLTAKVREQAETLESLKPRHSVRPPFYFTEDD